MNGASTNPSAHVFSNAAAQLKKGLDMALLIGAQNYGLFISHTRNNIYLSLLIFLK